MTRFRIGWAAPWNTRSAIAQSAAGVAFELVQRGHQVTVLRTEVGDWQTLPARPAPGPIHFLTDYSDADLNRSFDVTIAHIGDQFGFHGAIMTRLDTTKWIGIFHDACVPHLFRDWVHDRDDVLRDILAATYGPEAAMQEGPLWNDLGEVVRKRPLIEWLASRMKGAVAHALHYFDRLDHACPGPVASIPLAFEVPDLPPPPTPWHSLRIAIIGTVNANKRIDQLILAIGASHILRRRCRIRLIGIVTSDERYRLAALADSVGIVAPEFTGWVDDDELRWQLRDVDVISCLRNPVLEGSSASLILALTSGRPTLLTRHGCYAEVPTDAALACSPEHEALDVMFHLERLLQDPDYGREIGQQGRAFVIGRHSYKSYAAAIEDFITLVEDYSPRKEVQLQVAQTLATMGLGADDPAMARIMAAVPC